MLPKSVSLASRCSFRLVGKNEVKPPGVQSNGDCEPLKTTT